jgi:hypothetical protein
MAQIITTSTPGKEREYWSKTIVVTIRNFMRKPTPDSEAEDMVAYIIIALSEISKGIDQSVAAWEKRGYWVKADKYRLEWKWAENTYSKLSTSYKLRDWDTITTLLIDAMQKFANIKVSDRHRMGKPWVGAKLNYQKLNE